MRKGKIVRMARLCMALVFAAVLAGAMAGVHPIAAQELPAEMQDTAKRAVTRASVFALALRDGNHKAAYGYLHPELRQKMTFVQFLDMANLTELQGFENLVWKNYGISSDGLSHRAVGTVETPKGEVAIIATLGEDGGEMFVSSFRAKRASE